MTTLPRLQFLEPLRNRDFRLLWAGSLISGMGDQFYMVALPWLILRLTGSGLLLGTVLLAAAIPRAVFLVVGGAVTDRLLPRSLLIRANGLLGLLLAGLALLVWSGTIQIWMLVVFAFVLGAIDAFSLPAGFSIVPHLLDKTQLEAGNAFQATTGQVVSMVGPALVGVLIATWEGTQGDSGQATTSSLGVALGIDAITFFIALFLIAQVRLRQQPAGESPVPEPMVTSMRRGFQTAWHNAGLRAWLLLTSVFGFTLVGPLYVGIPVLAEARYAGGAMALGMMQSALGGGSLLGSILAGQLPRPRRFGPVALSLTAAIGLVWAMIGLAPDVLMAAALILLAATGIVYIDILKWAWMQRQTDANMQGRISSLMLLAGFGSHPFSYALAGVLVDWNLTLMFAGSGALLIVAALVATRSAAIRAT